MTLVYSVDKNEASPTLHIRESEYKYTIKTKHLIRCMIPFVLEIVIETDLSLFMPPKVGI